MFTGIIAATGEIRRARRRDGVLELTVEAPSIARDLGTGDSVAVNGVCLTAVSAGRRRFSAQVVGETLARTTLGDLERRERVNLELAARPTDRLGGHFVQGHVDAVSTLSGIAEDGASRRMTWHVSDGVLRYVVSKGSIALDGVSLTVSGVRDESFEVAVIPHTLEVTTLGGLRPGDRANIEVDLIAKYVEKLSAGIRRAEQEESA